MLAITTIAGVGAYRVYTTQASTAQYAISIETQKGDITGCWLAGRVWEDSSKKCKQACRHNSDTYIPYDRKADRRGYCKGHIATDVDKITCIDTLNRWYVKRLGCARRADNENTANARQCIGYNSTDLRAVRRYVNGKPDQCIGDRIHVKNRAQDITYPAKPVSEIVYTPMLGHPSFRSVSNVTLKTYLHGPFASADAANCTSNRTTYANEQLKVSRGGTYKLVTAESPSQNGWYKWSVEDPADTNSQVCGGAFHVKGCNCFTPADTAKINGINVWQQAPVPTSSSQNNYKYWPAHNISTNQTPSIAASNWTEGKRWSFLWANRRNQGHDTNIKANLLPGSVVKHNDIECRTTYTTIEQANAATRAHVRYLLGMGMDSVQQPWLATGGRASDFITHDALKANPGRYCTGPIQRIQVSGVWMIYREIPNKVILPAARLVDGPRPDLNAGIVLDYEVQDSRTPQQTTAFIKSVADDVHRMGKKLVLYTNPLNAPTIEWTGLNSSNLPTILDSVDYLTVLLWGNNRERSVPASYDAQIKLLGPLTASDWNKILVVHELGKDDAGTTLQDARWVYRKLHEDGRNHPTNVMFWRDWAEQGGPCDTLPNKKIATVLFGEPKPAW